MLSNDIPLEEIYSENELNNLLCFLNRNKNGINETNANNIKNPSAFAKHFINTVISNLSTKKQSHLLKSYKILLNLVEHSDNRQNEETKENEMIKEINIQTPITNSSPSLTLESNTFKIGENIIKKIGDIDLDVFALDKILGQEKTLPFVGIYIFTSYGLFDVISYEKFENWAYEIAMGYRRTSKYHNDLHGADITNACYVMVNSSNIISLLNMTKIETATLFLSAMCHDFKHPGVNNNFLKNSNDELAIQFNDFSILENMHISETFKLIRNNKNCDIFDGLSVETYKYMRKNMIQYVLGTDMINHQEQTQFITDNKNMFNSQVTPHCKHRLLEILLHAADISNSAKEYDNYMQFAVLVNAEFLDQGDREKKMGLPPSPGCDRATFNFYSGQIGFVENIILPFFVVFTDILTGIKFLLKPIKQNVILTKQKKEEDKNSESINKLLSEC